MPQEKGGTTAAMEEAARAKVWVTLRGLPLTISLEWPFHLSTSGADFWVLHGDIRLEGSDGLHALVAVNLSQTVREVMLSLEPKNAEAPVINALRKEVDRRQIEFVKSGKLLPVPFSSRHYDFKRGQWVFGKATEEAIAEFIERKVFWETKLSGSRPSNTVKDAPPSDGLTRVWIGNPAEAQYLQTTPAHVVDVAHRVLEAQGLLRVEGEGAQATAGLMAQSARFENARIAAVSELEKKHAFERG